MLMLFSNLDFVGCFYNLAPMQAVGICKFVFRLRDFLPPSQKSLLLSAKHCPVIKSIVEVLLSKPAGAV